MEEGYFTSEEDFLRYSCCVHYCEDTTPCGGDITNSTNKCANCEAKICNSCAGCRDSYCHYCDKNIAVCIICKRDETDLHTQKGGEINYCHTCNIYYCNDCGSECDTCLISYCPIHTKFFSVFTKLKKVKKTCNLCFTSNANKKIVYCKDHDLLIFCNSKTHKKCHKNKINV